MQIEDTSRKPAGQIQYNSDYKNQAQTHLRKISKQSDWGYQKTSWNAHEKKTSPQLQNNGMNQRSFHRHQLNSIDIIERGRKKCCSEKHDYGENSEVPWRK